MEEEASSVFYRIRCTDINVLQAAVEEDISNVLANMKKLVSKEIVDKMSAVYEFTLTGRLTLIQFDCLFSSYLDYIPYIFQETRSGRLPLISKMEADPCLRMVTIRLM